MLCLGLLPLFQAALARQGAEQPGSAIAIDDSADQDARIAMRIRNILDELDGSDDIMVTVTSGIVTLRGKTVEKARTTEPGDLVARVEGVVAIRNEVSQTADVVEQLNPAMQRFRNRMWQLVTFLPLTAVALAAFLLVMSLGVLIARLRQPWERIAPNPFIADIYRQVVRLAFAVAGLVWHWISSVPPRCCRRFWVRPESWASRSGSPCATRWRISSRRPCCRSVSLFGPTTR